MGIMTAIKENPDGPRARKAKLDISGVLR